VAHLIYATNQIPGIYKVVSSVHTFSLKFCVHLFCKIISSDSNNNASKQVSVVSTPQNVFGECSVRFSVQTTNNLSDVSRVFPQPFQTNAGTLRYFLSKPLQYVIHKSSYRLMLQTAVGAAQQIQPQPKTEQTPWPESASELYKPRHGRLSAKIADRGCHVVSVTDPYGRILGFLDRIRYFFLPSSSSVVLTRLSGPRSRPTASQKIW
jgi:hypothetical protein